ncbi:MAG: hypothetical protein NT062_07005 [Proteobacteria bacterium]|nr:hypothetical protein [Pseudomonadota bacterium]
MRIALVPLVWMTTIACSPDVEDPADRCGEAACPGGEVCDRSGATPACLDATADDDGDGLTNAEDLCPRLAGAPQFDKDADGIGDACDRCPIAPPAATPDTDGDEVDGVCDPDPELPGNRIVAFSGFRAATPGWTLPAGWAITGGDLVATVPGVSAGLLAIPIVGTNHVAIEASYRIDALATTGTPSITTIARDRRPAGTTLMQCGVAKIDTTERVQVSTDVDSANAVGMGLFDSAALYRLGFLIDGGQTGCAVVVNATNTKSTSARGGGEQMTEAGLDVGNATARFQWILVVAR